MTDADPPKKKGWNKGNMVHGLSKSSTYQTWRRLRSSCGPDATRPCKGKGKRTMDGRWMASFQLFLEDMGEAPPNHVLRIRKGSPLGCTHFSKEVCEWRPKDEPHYKRAMFDPAQVALSLAIAGERGQVALSLAIAGERGQVALSLAIAGERGMVAQALEATGAAAAQPQRREPRESAAAGAEIHEREPIPQPIDPRVAALLDMDYGDDDE